MCTEIDMDFVETTHYNIKILVYNMNITNTVTTMHVTVEGRNNDNMI